MKKQLLFANLIIVALLGLTIVSCSNDDGIATDQETGTLGIKPVKAPDFYIYSGDTVIDNTFTTKAMTRSSLSDDNYYKVTDRENDNENAKLYYTKYWEYGNNAPIKTDRDEQVSTSEYNYVIDYIAKHKDEGSTKCSLVNYFIQNVGSSYDTYGNDGNASITVHDDNMSDNNKATHHVCGGNQMDYLEIDGAHINDYNAAGGKRALCLGISVVNPTYHDSYGNNTYNSYKFYYIDGNSDGILDCYLCFDYKTSKDSGEHHDGDGVYNDWVIKLIPADGSEAVDPNKTTPTTPTTPTTSTNGKVEVNLSVNAEKSEGDYIATKLSIHVRDTTDVEVFIPVLPEYYCQADDMNIVLSHKLDAEAYNKSADYTTMNYVINGQTVTLNVAYALDGIHVTTSGINKEVLKYLRATYGDGITFEIWNYYKNSFTANNVKTEVTRETLKNTFLDKSTVSFTTGTAQYINAFGAIRLYEDRVYTVFNESTGKYEPHACTYNAETDEYTIGDVLPSICWEYSTEDPTEYVLKTSANIWDCMVAPKDTSYTLKSTDVYNLIYTK